MTVSEGFNLFQTYANEISAQFEMQDILFQGLRTFKFSYKMTGSVI